MESIIVFKTHPNDFDVNRNVEERNLNPNIDWEEIPYTSLKLSAVLNMQCKINAFNLSKLKQYCDLGSKERFKDDTIHLYDKNDIEFEDHGGLKPCLSFKNIYDDFLEVMSRDHDIFHENVSMMPYSVVLLDEYNQYAGHTYCWIFKGRVYSMGIRNKVESQFLKYSKSRKIKQIDNVSLYLLEGVRQFALRNGFDSFNIISPLEKMKTILREKLDFKYRRGNPMGSYIFDSQSTSNVLYYPENINITFVDGLLYDQVEE